MTAPGSRRRWILPALCVGFAAYSVYMIFSYGILRVRIAFAQEQIEIFEQMATKANKADDFREAASALRYAIHYYPSGSKQIAGSRLDDIVERSRRRAAADIVARLRMIAPIDHGDDPEAWLDLDAFGATKPVEPTGISSSPSDLITNHTSGNSPGGSLRR